MSLIRLLPVSADVIFGPPLLRGEIRGRPLTPSEVRLLDIAATGATAKEIADRCGLGTSTVKNHLSHGYAKLGVGNLVEAMNVLGWVRRLS